MRTPDQPGSVVSKLGDGGRHYFLIWDQRWSREARVMGRPRRAVTTAARWMKSRLRNMGHASDPGFRNGDARSLTERLAGRNRAHGLGKSRFFIVGVLARLTSFYFFFDKACWITSHPAETIASAMYLS